MSKWIFMFHLKLFLTSLTSVEFCGGIFKEVMMKTEALVGESLLTILLSEQTVQRKLNYEAPENETSSLKIFSLFH